MRNITIAKTFATSTLAVVAIAALSGEAKALNEFPSKPVSSVVVLSIVNSQAKIVNPAIFNTFVATSAPATNFAPPPAAPPQAPIAVGVAAGGGAGTAVKVPGGGAAASSGGATPGGGGGAKNVSFVPSGGGVVYARGDSSAVPGGSMRPQSIASVDQLISAPLQRDFGLARQTVLNKLENRPTARTVAGLGLAANTAASATTGRGQALQAIEEAKSLLQ